MQIRNHSPDDLQLLEIFKAEISPIGTHDLKKFQDHRSHTLEMARTESSAKRLRQIPDFHNRLKSL